MTALIGLDIKEYLPKSVNIFLPLILAYDLGAQKNRYTVFYNNVVVDLKSYEGSVTWRFCSKLKDFFTGFANALIIRHRIHLMQSHSSEMTFVVSLSYMVGSVVSRF